MDCLHIGPLYPGDICWTLHRVLRCQDGEIPSEMTWECEVQTMRAYSAFMPRTVGGNGEKSPIRFIESNKQKADHIFKKNNYPIFLRNLKRIFSKEREKLLQIFNFYVSITENTVEIYCVKWKKTSLENEQLNLSQEIKDWSFLITLREQRILMHGWISHLNYFTKAQYSNWWKLVEFGESIVEIKILYNPDKSVHFLARTVNYTRCSNIRFFS